MNRKQFAVSTLLALILLALSLVFIPSAHQQGSGIYDPWLDYNEDGAIDVNDLHPLGGAYGTSGDSTKNVNVTNWPTEQTLNASLADYLVISNEEPPAYFEVNVDGYSKTTLVLQRHTSAGTLIAYIHFKIGGVYTPLVYSNNTLAAGRHFLLRDYEVVGPTIGIELTAMGDPITVSLGIYAYG